MVEDARPLEGAFAEEVVEQAKVVLEGETYTTVLPGGVDRGELVEILLEERVGAERASLRDGRAVGEPHDRVFGIAALDREGVGEGVDAAGAQPHDRLVVVLHVG